MIIVINWLFTVHLICINVINSYTSYCMTCRLSGKAAIGYSYGDSVAEDYNSDNDSDIESVHEEEGCCVYMCVCSYIILYMHVYICNTLYLQHRSLELWCV